MIGSMTRHYLPDVMRYRADKDQLPSDHSLRIAANDMESAAIDRRSSLLEMRQAALAARRIWRRYSGNALYPSEMNDTDVAKVKCEAHAKSGL